MALLICCPSVQELSALVPALFPDARLIPEMQPISGQLNNKKTIFLVSGPGIINAAISVAYTLGITHNSSDQKISSILLFGMAHSFNLEQAPLLSIWNIKKEIWPEYGLNDGVSITAKAFSTPLWKRDNNEDIFDEIELSDLDQIPVSLNAPAYGWPSCSSLTLSGVTASFNRRNALWNYWHVPLENMEGFAVAYVGQRASIPCVEIRVVSAKAGPRSREEKDIDGALSVMSSLLKNLRLD